MDREINEAVQKGEEQVAKNNVQGTETQAFELVKQVDALWWEPRLRPQRPNQQEP